MDEHLKQLLISLACKYEVSSFCDEDPSQFLSWYQNQSDCELAGFIAAMLAFGNRKQFIPKIKFILESADSSQKGIHNWLKSGAYKNEFPSGEKKFYRFYSFTDMHIFFDELADILHKEKSLGTYLKTQYENALAKADIAGAENEISLAALISSAFPKSKIVPKGKNSANKRIHMFLRWMVRQNSPVDKGFWNWYPQSQLIIPLDVHVMQMAVQLKLIPAESNPNRKTAEKITEILKEVFPNDPVKGDFALFGAGIAE